MIKKRIQGVCVLFLAGFLASCDVGESLGNNSTNNEEFQGSTPIPFPRSIVSSRISPSDYDLQLEVNGESLPTRQNDDGTWVAEVVVQSGTSIDVLILWSAFEVDLAILELFVSDVSSNFQISPESSEYLLLDSDGDSFSNIDEIDNNTSVDDPNSFPAQVDESIFNTNQQNCATVEFFREAAAGAEFSSDLDRFEILPIPDLEIFNLNDPIRLNVGSETTIETPLSSTDLFVFEILHVLEPGALTISHLSGSPRDSVAELFERNSAEGLLRIGFNDDFTLESLNAGFTIQLSPGGYCILLRDFNRIPLLVDEDRGSTRMLYRLQ